MCPNCGREYSTTPRCTCSTCTRLQIDHCCHCCYIADVTILKPRVNISSRIFLCLSCLHSRNLDRLCTCCQAAFLCNGCCGHYCCSPTRPLATIQFQHRPLRFLYPARPTENSEPKNVQFVDREAALPILNNTAPVRIFNPKGFVGNRSTRFAGVELEFLHYKNAERLNGIVEKWNCSVVEDNSMVRNYLNAHPDTNRSLRGFEINTSPACGDALEWQLREICEGVNSAEAEISLSCGIHVHVDCRDYGYQEIQKLIEIYSSIEQALFAAVHWSRYQNEFCQPCGTVFHDKFIKGIKPDTKGLKSNIIKGVYGPRSLDATFARRHKQPSYYSSRADHYGRSEGMGRNPMRYSALNLHSYFLRGTVESRIHHASTSFDEIYGWTKILIELFDVIYKLPAQKILNILAVRKIDRVQLAEELDFAKAYRKDLNFNAVINGVVILRSLLSENNFNILLHKIRLACFHPEVSKTDVLPCQITV